MRQSENSLFELGTAESSLIIISKQPSFDDCGEEMEPYYKIEEADYSGQIWGFGFLKTIENCLAILENPPRNSGFNRNYVSWWLNFTPDYVHKSVKPLLKQRLKNYYLTGEIETTYRNQIYGKDGLGYWHDKLDIIYNKNSFRAIELNKDFMTYVRDNTIRIQFESFDTLLYKSFRLHYDKFPNFQLLLTYLYGCIDKEVPPYSYHDKWILYNSTQGTILKKADDFDMRNLTDAGINAGDRIVCYKLG